MEAASFSSSYGGGGGSGEKELGLLEVQAAAAALRRSEVFFVVKELLGFVLYMHHQIPSVLQNLENEFESLKEEMAEMTMPPAMFKPSDQRKFNRQKREVRCRIKKQEKLMNGISTLLSALQQALDEVPSIEGVTLVLGGSLVRPLFVYDITISHGRFDSGSAKESVLTKLAQSVSRKAIRALVSRGAGSLSHTGLLSSVLMNIGLDRHQLQTYCFPSHSCQGPSKLFLLVRCPCTLNLPLDFLPKRDFRYSKKVVPLRMHIKCSTEDRQVNTQNSISIVDAPCCTSGSSLSDVIWFQCKHTIRGLPGKALFEG